MYSCIALHGSTSLDNYGYPPRACVQAHVCVGVCGFVRARAWERGGGQSSMYRSSSNVHCICYEVHDLCNSLHLIQVRVKVQHLGATTGQALGLSSQQVDEMEEVAIHWTHQWHAQIPYIQHGANWRNVQVRCSWHVTHLATIILLALREQAFQVSSLWMPQPSRAKACPTCRDNGVGVC
jgi:hypothetical protein